MQRICNGTGTGCLDGGSGGGRARLALVSSPFPQPEGYDVHRVVGRGGAATVYEADDRRHGRTVAIKVLSGDAVGIEGMDEAQRRAFTREVRAMGRLGDHPNVVTVYDSGFLPDGRPFLVMPFVADGSLATRVRADGPRPVEEVLDIGVKISSALETAHQRGILHCDIKPSNLLVGPWGDTLLADFGIASVSAAGVTTTGVSSLTVAFAAPEVIADEPATVQSDIYSLGVTLYTLLEGTMPFSGESPAAIVSRVIENTEPPTPDVDLPEALRSLLRDMMAKRAEHRPTTVAEVVDRLQLVQRELGVSVTRAIYEPSPVREGDPRPEVDAGAAEASNDPTAPSATSPPPVATAPISPATDSGPHGNGRGRAAVAGAALVLLAIAALAVWRIAGTGGEDRGGPIAATATAPASPASSSGSDSPTSESVTTPTSVTLPTADPIDPSALGLLDPGIGDDVEEVAVAHTGGVNAIAWSSNGLFATGGEDDVVRLWDSEANLLNELALDGPVRDVSWSPDASLLAVASDAEVRVWDAASGSSTVMPDSRRVWDLSWNADGTELAGGAWTRVVLWDVPSAQLMVDIAIGEHTVWSVAISPDDGTVAALTSQGNVYEWAIGAPTEPTWSDEREIATHAGTVRYLDDGSLLVGAADSPIRIYDPLNGLFEIEDEWDPVELVPSPSGSLLLAIGQVSAVRVVHVGLAEVIATLDASDAPATTAAWSPDGRRVLAGDQAGAFHLWSLASPPAPILLFGLGAD